MKFKILLLFIFSLFFPACVQNTVLEGLEIPKNQIERIQPGVTQRADIIKWFGPPNYHKDPNTVKSLLQQIDSRGEYIKVDHPAFKDAYVYEFIKGRTEVFSIIIFNFFRDDRKQDHLIVFFNPDDTVKYYAYREGTKDIFKN